MIFCPSASQPPLFLSKLCLQVPGSLYAPAEHADILLPPFSYKISTIDLSQPCAISETRSMCRVCVCLRCFCMHLFVSCAHRCLHLMSLLSMMPLVCAPTCVGGCPGVGWYQRRPRRSVPAPPTCLWRAHVRRGPDTSSCLQKEEESR